MESGNAQSQIIRFRLSLSCFHTLSEESTAPNLCTCFLCCKLEVGLDVLYIRFGNAVVC